MAWWDRIWQPVGPNMAAKFGPGPNLAAIIGPPDNFQVGHFVP